MGIAKEHRIDGLAVIGSIVLLLCNSAVIAASDIQVSRIAMEGDSAPGTQLQFTSFFSPYADLPHPQIDTNGRVALFAILSDGSQGVWSQSADVDESLTLMAQTGDPAPGADGAVFFGFPSIVVPAAPQIGGDRSLVHAALTGGDFETFNFHTWLDSAGNLSSLVLTGDPAPGLPGITLRNPFGMLNQSGNVLLGSDLGGVGVTVDNDEAILTYIDDQLQLLAREGEPAPGTGVGVVFGRGVLGASPATFNERVINDSNQIAVQADLLGTGIDSFNDEALFVDLNGEGLSLLVREGDPAPGAGSGVTFGGNSVSLSLQNLTLNNLGQIAFDTRLGGTIPTTTALFSTHTGELMQLAQAGTKISGLAEPLLIIALPLLSDGGHIAFRASLEGGFFPPLGVVWDQPGVPGELEPLIMPGEPLPGQDGRTFNSATRLLGYLEDGRLFFTGSLDDPEDGPAAAIFMAEPDGTIATLMTVGDQIDISDGDGEEFKTLQQFHAIRGAVNASGDVVTVLEFTDGTMGIFTLSPQVSIPGDIDDDGTVDTEDLLALLAAWGPCNQCAEDLDGSGDVGTQDLLTLLANWG